jgi:hypothetical protein
VVKCSRRFVHSDGVSTVWKPIGITASVWWRIERPGKRTRFSYDAGGSLYRTFESQEQGDYYIDYVFGVHKHPIWHPKSGFYWGRVTK